MNNTYNEKELTIDTKIFLSNYEREIILITTIELLIKNQNQSRYSFCIWLF